MNTVELTIVAINSDGEICPPRTKKNSPQIIPHMTHPILVPSEAYRAWERAAKRQLVQDAVCVKPGRVDSIRWAGEPITEPVNCEARFYRDALRGDAVGFYQGLADFLQEIGVVKNDSLIVSWNGSRLLKCAERPRIELVLTPIEKPAELFP